MAKSKVINTVLQLRDNMSGGLLKAAKNAKKSGADISDSMMNATRQVVAFKNKAVDGIKTFAKTAMGVGVAGASALTTAFLALDGATEEYRTNQGKLQAAFARTEMGFQGARKAYVEFYEILGDSATATEAAQALSTLAKNQEDVTKWTRVAAGVVGKFGDGISVNSLFQDIGESAVSGAVTGGLADALNWIGISEDSFNEKLEDTGSTAERATLILNTLTTAYDGYADAFYQNNAQLVKSRNYQTQLSNTMAVLGDASAKAKNGILELLGAQESGGFREGSALAILTEQAEAFASWTQSADFSAFAAKVDQGVAKGLELAKQGFQWVWDNREMLAGAIQKIAVAFAGMKLLKFGSDTASAIMTLGRFGKTIATLAGNPLPKLLSVMKGGLGTALTGLTQGIGAAGGGLLKMGSAAGGAIKALMGLLAANPVILIVVGAIAALVAIGIAIYKNWDTIKAGALALWETVKEKFQGIKDAITNAFNSVLEWAGKLKDFFVDTFLGAINKVKETFDKVKDAVGGLINKVKDFLGMDTNKEVKVTTKYDDSHGHNALGTSYWRGGPTAVHERGGEIIDLPNGTRIIPHDVSEKMAGGRNVNVYVTVQGNVIGNRQYADELGEIVVGKVLRAMDNV